MYEVNLLGISEDSITVIFDNIKDTLLIDSFLIFPNIELNIKPYTPITKENYKIRDIHGDTDNKILERIKSQLEWFEEQKKRR